jgi:hypothetical protein
MQMDEHAAGRDSGTDKTFAFCIALCLNTFALCHRYLVTGCFLLKFNCFYIFGRKPSWVGDPSSFTSFNDSTIVQQYLQMPGWMEWGLAERLGEHLQMGRRCSLSMIMSASILYQLFWRTVFFNGRGKSISGLVFPCFVLRLSKAIESINWNSCGLF